ncbi:MAG: hypothetical protein AB8G96_02720 [Phycisphaerales bacterium]
MSAGIWMTAPSPTSSAFAHSSGAAFTARAMSESIPTIIVDQVTDVERGFALRVPDGFQPRPDLVEADAETRYAFSRASSSGELATLLILNDMDGPIPPERLLGGKPEGIDGRRGTMSWRGFELDLFEIRESVDGVPAITLNVQVPLETGGLQVGVFGPASRAAQSRAALFEVLGSLRGATNWTSMDRDGVPVAEREAPEAVTGNGTTAGSDSDAGSAGMDATTRARDSSRPATAGAEPSGVRGIIARGERWIEGREMFVLLGLVLIGAAIAGVLIRRASSGRL